MWSIINKCHRDTIEYKPAPRKKAVICSLSLGCVYLSMVHTNFGVRSEPRLICIEETVILVSGQRDAMVLQSIEPV